MSATDSHDGHIQGASAPSGMPLNTDGETIAPGAQLNMSAETIAPGMQLNMDGETISPGMQLKMGASPVPPPQVREADVFEPGEIVGGSYKIIDLLGRGAMGMVYRAEHVTMSSVYALKVLTTQQLTENAVLRFQNEAQALAKLNHPNLIAIYNFGLHEGRLPFYVMDLLHGENMQDKIEKYGPMPVDLAIPVFMEICAGLSYAHRKGILHRDVKPANFVMLDTPDVRGARIKIVDFGLVKFAEELKPDAQKLTAIGEVCGSPSYMSPEQASGKKIDSRSDIYSLGCSLFQVVTGRVPFMGRNATETMMMHFEKEAPSMASKAGIAFPYDLERFMAMMLAKQPMDRYQTMEAVAQDLKNILERQPLGTPQVLQGTAGRAASATNPSITIAPQNSTRGTASAGTAFGGTATGGTATGGTTAGATAAGGTASADTAGGSASAGTAAGGEQAKRIQAFQWNNEPVGQPFGDAPNVSHLNVSQRIRPDTFTPGGSFERAEKAGSSNEKKLVTGAIVAGAVLLAVVVGFFAWQALKPVTPLSSMAGVPIAKNPDAKSAAADSNQPFSKIVTENNKQYIEFGFPTENVNANLISGGGYGALSTSKTDYKMMTGAVRFPKGSCLYIAPSKNCLKLPHFFERFRPGEITGIYSIPAEGAEDLFISGLKTPGITQVFCNDADELTAAIVPALSNLKIEILMATGLRVDGRSLARSHFWPNLKVLDLSAGRNLTDVLKNLGGSEKLEMLNVSRTNLGNSDYKLISNIPGLYCLNLAGNLLTSEDFQAISRLPNLHTLDLLRSKVQGVNLGQELRHFPHLKTLVLAADDLSAADKQALKHDCPHLKLREEDPALLQSEFGHDRRRNHRGFGGERHHDSRDDNFAFALLQSSESGDSDLQGPTMKQLEKQFMGSSPRHSRSPMEKKTNEHGADNKDDINALRDLESPSRDY
jgi:serine/threonine protein kinase